MLLLEFREVTKVFRQKLLKKGKLEAVKGVSLEIRTGEIFGLMGESGSGKSTLGKIALGLMHPSSGEVLWEGSSGRVSLPKSVWLCRGSARIRMVSSIPGIK